MVSKKQDELIDFEIRFFEGILQNDPNFIQALAALGDVYTKKGLFEKGLAIDRKLVELRPDDPTILYNLSCSFSLLENMDQAFLAIKRAVECGYDDFSHMRRDKDLANLRKDKRFRKYFDEMKKERDPK